MRSIRLTVLGLLLIVGCVGCGKKEAITLSIVSGSENKSLESLVRELGRQHGINVQMTYLGSVDIAREMQKGKDCPYDAVWPASRMVEKFSRRYPIEFLCVYGILG